MCVCICIASFTIFLAIEFFCSFSSFVSLSLSHFIAILHILPNHTHTHTQERRGKNVLGDINLANCLAEECALPVLQEHKEYSLYRQGKYDYARQQHPQQQQQHPDDTNSAEICMPTCGCLCVWINFQEL